MAPEALVTPQAAPPPPEPAPVRCAVCGRQDETVRAVAYPYVFSLVLVTFRRAFAGVWCRKHRRQRLWLAGAITSVVGWWGLPFGFLYTPVALFQIAKGGRQPPGLNAAILNSLADLKARQGDSAGAQRCLESALCFQDDDAVRSRLAELAGPLAALSANAGCAAQALTLAAILFGAAGIGASAGVAQSLVGMGLGAALHGETLLEALLSWIPLVSAAFLGGLALFRLVEWAVARLRSRQAALSSLLALIAAIAASYSLVQGEALVLFARGLVTGFFHKGPEAVAAGVVFVLLGGYARLAAALKAAGAADWVFLGLSTLTALYYAGFAVRAALRTVHWQRRLVQGAARQAPATSP